MRSRIAQSVIEYALLLIVVMGATAVLLSRINKPTGAMKGYLDKASTTMLNTH